MKQRLGVAAALLGSAALLVLDEPANGLDPDGVREMRSLVARLAGEDRTVLVSSHDLSEHEVYPGQVLASLTQGGPAELGLGQATVTAVAYAAVAAATAVLLLHRRDVTA